MASFSLSSHHKQWLMNHEEIVRLRIQAILTLDEPVRTISDNVFTLDISPDILKIINEEDIILVRYSGIIQQAFGIQDNQEKNGSKLSWRLSATAIMYFRRFYLNNSLLLHDPRIVMIACVYLAGKVEECQVKLQDIFAIHKDCTSDSLLAYERNLIQGLNFQLQVFHPQPCLYAMYEDYKIQCQALCEKESLPEADLKQQAELRREWRRRAEAVAVRLQRTSACLRLSPLEIAVFCLMSTFPTELKAAFGDYLKRRFGDQCAPLLDRASCAALCDAELAAATDDSAFKQAMRRLKKQGSWDKPKQPVSAT